MTTTEGTGAEHLPTKIFKCPGYARRFARGFARGGILTAGLDSHIRVRVRVIVIVLVIVIGKYFVCSIQELN